MKALRFFPQDWFKHATAQNILLGTHSEDIAVFKTGRVWLALRGRITKPEETEFPDDELPLSVVECKTWLNHDYMYFNILPSKSFRGKFKYISVVVVADQTEKFVYHHNYNDHIDLTGHTLTFDRLKMHIP